MSNVPQNLARIQARIAEAARRSGRSPEDVTLVAVTKYVDESVARSLVEAGCLDLGESRPQQLWQRVEAFTSLGVRWHMIGHLQRNKAARTLPLVQLLHSADSLRLLQAASEIATGTGRPLRVLLEVNVSGDSAKHGFAPADLAPALPQILELPGLEVCGLMAMAALEGGPDIARANFARLRELRDDPQARSGDACQLVELSMGMSDDYEIAIEEGATLVRVGSALFE